MSIRGGRWRGIKYGIVVALILTMLAFPLTALAAPAHESLSNAGNGHIYGQLRDGTRHNAPVAGQSVTLQVAHGSNTSDLASMPTDSHGMFSFGGLTTDKTYNYAVYTLYQKAQYVTNLIDLSSKPAQQVNLTVYDATGSTSKIAVVQSNILIADADAQNGLLTITQSYFFENLGLTTYVGTLSANGKKPNALLFSLPAGAQHLSLKTGFDGYNQAQVDSGFASDAALPPGISQFAFSFQVPYSTSHYDFGYTVLYPTVALALLLPLNYHANSAALVAQGTVNTNNQTYQELSAQKLLANAQLHVELDGLPAHINTSNTAAPGLNLSWLILIALAMFAILGITWYAAARARRRSGSTRLSMSTQKARAGAAQTNAHPSTRTTTRNRAPVVLETQDAHTQQEPEETRQEKLLAELLALDKAYEAGTIKKAAYDERRAKLKARLRTLMSTGSDEKTRTASATTKAASAPAKKAAKSGGKKA